MNPKTETYRGPKAKLRPVTTCPDSTGPDFYMVKGQVATRCHIIRNLYIKLMDNGNNQIFLSNYDGWLTLEEFERFKNGAVKPT